MLSCFECVQAGIQLIKFFRLRSCETPQVLPCHKHVFHFFPVPNACDGVSDRLDISSSKARDLAFSSVSRANISMLAVGSPPKDTPTLDLEKVSYSKFPSQTGRTAVGSPSWEVRPDPVNEAIGVPGSYAPS